VPEEASCAGRPQARGPARDREGLRLDHRAGRLQVAGRAPRARGEPRHRPQRHGGPEDEGYITHPHTSAGRIPTDKGYRLFVDQLSSVKPLSSAEKRAIQSFLEGAVDLDDVVRRSVRLLAQLTRHVAVVQYPSLSRSAVRHLEIVHLAPNRLLLVLITDTGRVEQRVVELQGTVGDDEVSTLRQAFGSRLHGARLVDVPAALSDLPTRRRRRSARC
jgi:heat-inducible transcriptional repressor